jgi:hypothetical protein
MAHTRLMAPNAGEDLNPSAGEDPDPTAGEDLDPLTNILICVILFFAQNCPLNYYF